METAPASSVRPASNALSQFQDTSQADLIAQQAPTLLQEVSIASSASLVWTALRMAPRQPVVLRVSPPPTSSAVVLHARPAQRTTSAPSQRLLCAVRFTSTQSSRTPITRCVSLVPTAMTVRASLSRTKTPYHAWLATTLSLLTLCARRAPKDTCVPLAQRLYLFSALVVPTPTKDRPRASLAQMSSTHYPARSTALLSLQGTGSTMLMIISRCAPTPPTVDGVRKLAPRALTATCAQR